MANPKINLVHFSSAPGGIEVLMPELMKSFRERVFSVFIIRPFKRGRVNVYNDNSIPVNYGSNINLIAFIKLYLFIRKRKNEIFHVFNLGPYYLLFLKLAGIRNLVYSVRGSIYWKTKFQELIRRPIWALAAADFFNYIANSEFSRRSFSDATGMTMQKIEVVYNPVFSKRFQSAGSNGKTGDMRIIYVGRLAEGKNLFRWIDIAAEIYRRFENARFFLYGEGPLKESLVSYSKGKGIADVLNFEGHISQIATAYRKADFLLFLSEYESFGNVVVESILCETPVITSDIPSMREIFRNFPEFLVKLDGDLQQNVITKLETSGHLKSLAREAKLEFSTRFSIENHINKLNKIYGSFN